MADDSCTDVIELEKLDTNTAIAITVEEDQEPSLSADDEENTGSKNESFSDIKESPTLDEDKAGLIADAVQAVDEDGHNTLAEVIKAGNVKAVTDWLAKLNSDETKKTELNTIKYKYAMGSSGREHQGTVLHLAVKYNHPAIAKLLIDEGADPNKKDSGKYNALHVACTASSDDDITEIVKLLIERDCNIDEQSDSRSTPLHYATINNHPEAVRILLENNADMKIANNFGYLTIHWAAYNQQCEIIEALAEKNAECVNWKTESSVLGKKTPLQFLLDPIKSLNYTSHQLEATKCLINKGAKLIDTNSQGTPVTPLVWARRVYKELVKECTESDSPSDLPISVKDDLLAVACYLGHSDHISLLLERGAKPNEIALEYALKKGYKDNVNQLLKTPQWPMCMRHTFKAKGKQTTPFREMIRKLPGVAEDILDKCTLNNSKYENLDDKNYSVLFNYEFIEDTRDESKTKRESKSQKNVELEHGCNYETIRKKSRSNYTTSWGPVGFKKANHPLAIMVKYKRLNLLTHPLVGSLLHRKWSKFGQSAYFLNLLTYSIFLIFLTTFALITENPRSQSCLSMSLNISGNGTDCSVTMGRRRVIYLSVIVVIISSLCRLVLEGIQFVTQFPHYLLDWINWIEIALYVCSINFVWVFHEDCLCPLTWQWQIGVVAVFLGWIDLIVFISKFPLTGIYVLMFVKILYTFLKILILSILLVLAFGLTFYLAFTEPEILRSPFSTPGISFIKLMSMTAGDFDFGSIFRLDPAGGSDDAEEVPFPPVSYLLWIVFVIVMPILLINMLVGLAVDDIQAIQNEAELQKLTLQVEQVLTVEELLPRKWRRQRTTGYKEIYPNRTASWSKKFLFFLWGGKKYDTRESVEKVLHSQESENERIQNKTDELLQKAEDLKTSIDSENEKINQKSDEMIHQIADLKTSIEDEKKEVLENLKASVDESVRLVHEVEDLKTSVDDMKQLLKQIAMKLNSRDE